MSSEVGSEAISICRRDLEPVGEVKSLSEPQDQPLHEGLVCREGLYTRLSHFALDLLGHTTLEGLNELGGVEP